MCKCKVCTYSKEVRQTILRVTVAGDDREFLFDLYQRYIHADMDLNHSNAIIDGSWPNADKLITLARRRRNASATRSPNRRASNRKGSKKKKQP